MQQGVHMMIERELRKFDADLAAWCSSVTQARTNLDAARLASHKPVPGQLARTLSSVTNAGSNKAQRTVEKNLLQRVSEMSIDDPHLISMMRMTQGHWPEVYRKLEEMRREKVKAMEDEARKDARGTSTEA